MTSELVEYKQKKVITQKASSRVINKPPNYDELIKKVDISNIKCSNDTELW